MLLEANQIKQYMKDKILLDIEHLTIGSNDRIGLVGRNGSGKTTLLEILAGKRTPDSGVITINTSLEFLPQLKRTNTTKSGGEVTQEYINQAITSNAEILFADEPTTHLDTAHIEWLEEKLANWLGALVLISHDRAFLDSLCTVIWEIDNKNITVYKGNYSDYVDQKELERRTHQTEYEKYEKKKKQLEEAIILKERKAEKATKKPKNVNLAEARNSKPYYANKKKKLQQTAKAMETRLEKLEKVEKGGELAPIKMNLPNEAIFKNKIVLRVNHLQGAVGKRILWKGGSFTVRGGDKLAIIGANGSGKTTLLKKMIEGDSAISISPLMKIGYFSQNLDSLLAEKSILENVQLTSNQDETFIRTVLARLHFFREDVYKKVGVLSGGERVKVAFAKLFVSDINTLILDEPTNFLDIQSVEALESLLEQYEGTIIFVSHDRRFISQIANRIIEIKDGQLQLFEGPYNEFIQYKPMQAIQVDYEEKRLLIETKITEVLSRLSIEPSPELEIEFQRLLAEKRTMS
ncbi:Vga family ABC-F type ribosomal protection protein [Bacillus sp. T3]|uniref:Vga family ABC-F type ribosomal protection protein n=1 Tax=Bacillus sp. T3 TaxID=467262 RepID=UPI002981C68F|nr:ABC-F type ribosomal protection protein [Bacillus sp. T3]